MTNPRPKLYLAISAGIVAAIATIAPLVHFTGLIVLIAFAAFLAGWLASEAGKSLCAAFMLLALPAAMLGGPNEAVAMAAADLAKLAEYDRQFMGYLWHPQPFLPSGAAGAVGVAAAEDFDPVLRFHANELSTKGTLEAPVRIAIDLWRVDLRHYNWTREVWEKMAKHNIFFNESFLVKLRSGKRVKRFGPATWLPIEPLAYLIEQTGSRTPIVHAGWFLANTSRQLALNNQQKGFGYWDWLQVKNRNDFFKIADVRIAEIIKREKDILEVVSKSGVSKQNRRVQAIRTINGWLFFTEDTDNATGRGNAIKNLARADFKHNAEEHYLPLNNGLPAYLACNDQGVLQAVVPTNIGGDDSPLNTSKDPGIHPAKNCIFCHAGNVLQPVRGWARENLTIDKLALNVQSVSKLFDRETQRKLAEDLQRQYLKLNFNNALNEQRQAYRFAIQEACGLDPQTLARRFSRAYHAYDSPVTIDTAARELGYTVEEVRAAFTKYGGLEAVRAGTGPGGIDLELGSLITNPRETMPRLAWEDSYAQAQHIMSYQPKGKP